MQANRKAKHFFGFTVKNGVPGLFLFLLCLIQYNKPKHHAMNKLASQAKDHTRKHAGEWIETYARIGIAAKGLVYILVGTLAAMTIFTGEGKNEGRQGALQLILEQPFGKILLGATVVALLGYVSWRMIQTFIDPDDKGNDTEGIMKRAGFFISGLIYLFFAFSGLRMLFPGAGSSGDNGDEGGGRQLLVAKALEQPFGQWLVAIGAALVIGKGVFQLYKAYTGKFKKNIKEDEMSERQRTTFMHAGRIGYTARGIVMGILGYFLIRAAMNANPSEAQGTDAALSFISTSSGSGPYLMAAVAIGLVCYGLFMFVKAKYRQIPTIISSSSSY